MGTPLVPWYSWDVPFNPWTTHWSPGTSWGPLCLLLTPWYPQGVPFDLQGVLFDPLEPSAIPIDPLGHPKPPLNSLEPHRHPKWTPGTPGTLLTHWSHFDPQSKDRQNNFKIWYRAPTLNKTSAQFTPGLVVSFGRKKCEEQGRVDFPSLLSENLA